MLPTLAISWEATALDNTIPFPFRVVIAVGVAAATAATTTATNTTAAKAIAEFLTTNVLQIEVGKCMAFFLLLMYRTVWHFRSRKDCFT